MYYCGISNHLDRVFISTLKKGVRGVQLVETRVQDRSKAFANYPSSKYSQLIRESKVFFKRMRLPVQREKNILAALPFQMQPSIPFAIENAVLGYRKQEGSFKGDVEVFAIEKQFVQRDEQQKSSHFTTSWTLALWEYVRWAKPEFEGEVFIVQDRLFVSFEISKKGIEDALSIELEEESRLEKVLRRKEKTLERKKPLLCLGPETEKILMHISESNYLIQEIEEKYAPKQALSIGAALHQIYKGVNFFSDEIEKSKRNRFSLFASVILCVFTLTLLGFNGLFIQKEEKRIYATLSQIHTSLFGKQAPNEDNLVLIRKIKKELFKLKKTPIFSKQHSVMETLASVKKKTNWSENFELKKFHFDRQSFPSSEQPSAPHKVRVELLISAADPIEIEKWILELQSLPNWIDQKKGVEYQRRGNEYAVAFFLK